MTGAPQARRGDAAARLRHLVLDGPAGAIEAVLQERATDEGPAGLTALLCHPHPLYGGTLHNKVVHRMASALHALGAVVLRFNFRGAGASAGRFDQGVGELEDARAALRWLERRHRGARQWAGGFSFGSWVAARLAAEEARIERVILVAPPVDTQSFAAMHASPVPKLVIQGTADDVCPLASLEAELPRWAEPKRLVRVEGAGHFFDRKLGDLGAVLRDALAEAARGGRP